MGSPCSDGARGATHQAEHVVRRETKAAWHARTPALYDSKHRTISAWGVFLSQVQATADHDHSDWDGTREPSNSSMVQPWSVSPAAMAGATGVHQGHEALKHHNGKGDTIQVGKRLCHLLIITGQAAKACPPL